MPSDERHYLPAEVAQKAIASLIEHPPTSEDRILIVGNLDSVLDEISKSQLNNDRSVTILAVETSEKKIGRVREKHSDTMRNLQILGVEFETANLGEFEYVVLVPPSVPAGRELTDDDYQQARDRFELKGKFDLSSVYLANGLSHLAVGGRLVAVLPTSFLDASSAAPLRRRLVDDFHVESIQLLAPPEEIGSRISMNSGDEGFILTVTKAGDGATETPSGPQRLPKAGGNWVRAVQGIDPPVESDYTLDDLTHRISAGISTGADDVFIFEKSEIPPQFNQQWIYPVVGGRDLAASETLQTNKRIITPYQADGTEASLEQLEEIGEWLGYHRDKLERRQSRRGQPWYAWIRRPPMEDLLTQKILVRDFTDDVKFHFDRKGEYIPRRSVFYIISSEKVDPTKLLTYLNQPKVSKWIEGSSLGAEGMTRLSVKELENIPVSPDLLTN